MGPDKGGGMYMCMSKRRLERMWIAFLSGKCQNEILDILGGDFYA